MELLHTIDLARDLTKRLHAALESQDLEVCRDLLEQRGQAMGDLERAHRGSSDQERDNCRADIVALVRADGHLQERSKEVLAMVAVEFREQLGLPANGIHPAGGDPLQACLDRKA
jgi:hypothetical protein